MSYPQPRVGIRGVLFGAGLFAISTVCFWFLASRPEVIRSSLADAQLIAFPVVVLAMAFLARDIISIPRLITFALLLVWIALAMHTSFALRIATNTPRVLVSVFEGDRLEIDTSRFLRALSDEMGEMGLPAPRRIPRSNRAEDLVGKTAMSGQAGMVVSGSPRWLNLEFPADDLPRLGEDGELILRRINSVPAIGLSGQPFPATISFISTLSAGLQALQANRPLFEVEALLVEAAQMEAFWTSNAHRAYPLFLLANRQLEESYANGEWQPGELNCALRSYLAAARIMDGENPELHAAIENNFALALYLKRSFEKGVSLRDIRLHLRIAKAQSERQNPWGIEYRAPVIAAENLKVLNFMKGDEE